jgi:hypothetical protein
VYDIASPNLLKGLPKDPYVEASGLDRSVVPPVVDRTDPKLLPATDLEGGAVTAIFAFESEEERKRRELEERRRLEREKREQEEAMKKGEGDLLGGSTRGGRGAGGFDAAGEPTVDDQGRKIRPIPGGSVQEGVATTGYERFKASSVAYVLAKAPILAQAKIYEETLQDSKGYNPGFDIPRYAGVYVERAEVTGEDEAELKWEEIRFGSLAESKSYPALNDYSLGKMIGDWIPWPEQLVDGRYMHPVLTMPLPPLVQQNWSADVVHSDAPLQAETDAKEAAKSATESGVAEELPAEDAGETGFGRPGGMAGPGGAGEFGRGRMPMAGGFRGGGEFGGRGGGEFSGEFGGRGGGEFGGGRGGYSGAAARGGAMGDYVINPDVPFAMVRIFDFGVQPGRQYRYRVKLVLEDVNALNPSRPEVSASLSTEVTDRVRKSKSPFLSTEWSEPSSIISVPMAGDALVEGAKLPGGNAPSSEGSVDLLVQSYALDEDRRAIKAGVEKPFRIGAVLNLVENPWVVSPDGQHLVEMKSFKFRTGLTLCDFQGGEELPGKQKAPVKALFMDAAGRLFVHDQIDDRSQVQNYKNLFDENAANAGGGFMPRGGGGEFGGGRGGGEFR